MIEVRLELMHSGSGLLEAHKESLIAQVGDIRFREAERSNGGLG